MNIEDATNKGQKSNTLYITTVSSCMDFSTSNSCVTFGAMF